MSIQELVARQPDQLAQLIVNQRWFGDKSRTVRDVRHALLHEFVHDGGQYGLINVEFDFEQGEPATYFVPVLHRTDGTLVDALHDPGFLDWLADGFRDNATIVATHADGGRIVWSTPRENVHPTWMAHPGRVLTGEQSNTSVIFGSEAILKVFRKLQSGINPDSEIVAFLTEGDTFGHVPPYFGSIHLDLEGNRDSTELAAVQGYVSNEGDCWRWLPGALATASPDGSRELLRSTRLLGQRTGEMHIALAAGEGTPAFEAEPVARDNVKAIEERLAREVQLTVSMLYRQGACSHAESEQLESSLLASVSHASDLLGSLQTRVHGDYHLGQVLRAGNDFVVIDFEGEPSRPMRERRQKHPPLKDVAGMLRSIDYAVATAAQHGSPAGTDLQAWRVDAEAAFLAGYLDVVRAQDKTLVPAEQGAFDHALDVFMIEKALYEVRYELDNRPDWLDIPLGALRRIGAGG